MTAGTVHASCIAVDGRACLIRGAAGSGKSTLALQAIALGAILVADDRTRLWAQDGRAMAGAPPEIAGLIEARGAGLLRLPFAPEAEVVLIADLDRPAEGRLPDPRTCDLHGIPCPVIFGSGRVGLAAIVLAILRHGLIGPANLTL